MNIGLLVSELEDKEVKKICIGAKQAANDRQINLVIMPGGYLISEQEEDDPFSYQYSALFDYANSEEFDALIIDIDRIGKTATILKKEAFLNKFSEIPVLTLTEQEGYMSINQIETDHDQFEQIGYEAVYDAFYYVSENKLPSPAPVQKCSYIENDSLQAIKVLSDIGYKLLNRKYQSEKAYSEFIKIASSYEIKNCGIYIYDKKVRNNIKYWWNKPEEITVKGYMKNGIIVNEDQSISTGKIISSFVGKNNKVLIAGNIFVGESQLGIFITDFINSVLTDYFFKSIVSILTGVARVSYLEKELRKTNEELYEVQEELARDDSVLDHIGDQDYLTGGLNRRGFFAKAYDLLKENFGPGSVAIVAYIHMESLKGINQMFGHEEGDRAVKKISGILEEVFEDCIYGRIRGDEFAVIDITNEDGKADFFREQMSEQNANLLSESTRYINHLQYSICEFGYDKNLSLREMLKETDENLQRIKSNK